jgi:allantoate deiminase
METRRDPMAALADFATCLFARARSLPDSVATLGAVTALPGAANVIPSSVRVSVDARAATTGALSALLATIDEGAKAAASRSGCTAKVRLDDSAPPTQMDTGIMDVLDAAIRSCDMEPLRLPSGAGHDAVVLAAAGVPTGMLFVRSGAGGVSHTPQESTSREDIGIATTVFERALRLLADR